MPGILDATTTHCGRDAGNSSNNPRGAGCGALDLCAAGFHVCAGAADVQANAPAGCAGVTSAPNLFFATRQGSTGCKICTLGGNTDPSVCNGCSCANDCATTSLTANDIFGCGTLGDPVTTCGVLDHFSNDECLSLGAPWSCGMDDCHEANNVVKTGPARGGVLCCAD